MSFNKFTPLSYVRSTCRDTPSIGERRRRPTFSLHLDTLVPASATSSQLTTPQLSPTSTFNLSASESIINSPFSTPSTPVDADIEWPEYQKDLVERVSNDRGAL